MLEKLRQEVEESARQALIEEYGNLDFEVKVEIPANLEMGHLAVPCFPLAKALKKNPADIASWLAEKIQLRDSFASVEAVGPFLNFKVKGSAFFSSCQDILEKGDSFCSCNVGEGKKVMVEYISPNTNKPIHLGHLRNGALGKAFINLLRAVGYVVIPACLINDRGIHICKSMLAWQKWANGETPESTGEKGDHFVGRYYVTFEQKVGTDVNLTEQLDTMLLEWEDGNKDVRVLWSKMNQWVYDGWQETFAAFGFDFEVWMYESVTYLLGKDLVKRGLDKGIFHEDAIPNSLRQPVIFYLPKERFGLNEEGQIKKETVLRANGTGLYITQDIGTAVQKFEQYGLHRSIYVVADEQINHFQVLFEILRALGYEWADRCHHAYYGMVNLPDGRMKSREGTTVDADDLLGNVENLAREEILSRDPDNKLNEGEIAKRSRAIALAAINFYLLQFRSHLAIEFDVEKSLSFDGETGPYCLYAYARIHSIMREAQAQNIDLQNLNFDLLGNTEEVALMMKLLSFPEIIKRAAEDLTPATVAKEVYQLAQLFNQFYNKHRVISDDRELSKARLALIQAAAVVIKTGLGILGIETLDQM